MLSDIIMESIYDGDCETKIKDVAYSTSPRSLVTIRDMIRYYWRKERESYETINDGRKENRSFKMAR